MERIETLLPISFGFAAGAMLTLVAIELAPQAYRRESLPLAVAGTGALVMIALAVGLGV